MGLTALHTKEISLVNNEQACQKSFYFSDIAVADRVVTLSLYRILLHLTLSLPNLKANSLN